MEFIDWCAIVLQALDEIVQSSAEAQSYGVDESALAEAIFRDNNRPEQQYQAIFDAARELRKNGLVTGDNSAWLLTEAGRQHATDQRALWRDVCHVDLAFAEERQLLVLINRLSQQEQPNCAWLEYVDQDTVLAQLNGTEPHQLRVTAQRLVDIGLIDAEFMSQSADFRATYRGLVWSTRCVRSSVFISYRRNPSEAYALLIAEKLAPYGMKVFLDTLTVEGAEAFPERLLRGIEVCDVFICLLAPSTLDSDWVRREVEYAHSLGKPMIPVFQPDYTPDPAASFPGPLADLLQYEGVTMNSGYIMAAIEKLAAMIEQTWYKQFKRPSH